MLEPACERPQACLPRHGLDRGYYDADVVRGIVDDHLQRRVDREQGIWVLLALEIGHRLFVGRWKRRGSGQNQGGLRPLFGHPAGNIMSSGWAERRALCCQTSKQASPDLGKLRDWSPQEAMKVPSSVSDNGDWSRISWHRCPSSGVISISAEGKTSEHYYAGNRQQESSPGPRTATI